MYLHFSAVIHDKEPVADIYIWAKNYFVKNVS